MTTWTTRSGSQIEISKLSDQHLVNILRMLQRDAEARRESSILHDGSMFDRNPITWRGCVGPDFEALEEEADRRELKWDLSDNKPINEIIDLSTIRGTLERRIVGALRSCIAAHGPIDATNVCSAGKRVIGAIKDFNRSKR